MRLKFLKHNREQRLLLFFDGWASHPDAHRDLIFDGYDTLVAYGYDNLDFDMSRLDGYIEIAVVGWSYGVAVATRFLESNRDLPVTLRLAVNGTVYTVNDSYGIPEKIFNATLSGLNSRSLAKFYRRVCGSGEATDRFRSSLPDESIETLTKQLSTLGALPAGTPYVWDYAYISDEDYIIPADNQAKAWQSAKIPVKHIRGPHLADFKTIIEAHLINKPLVGKRFGESRQTYSTQASIQAEIAGIMAGMLPEKCVHAIEIGAGIRPITAGLKADRLTWVDLDTSKVNNTENVTTVAADAELWVRLQAEMSADCIVSASTIQWFNSPARFVEYAMRVLKPGGTLLVSTFGDETFAELSRWTRQLPFLSASRWQEILPCDAEIISLRRRLKFNSAREMLRHIADTGVNAITSSNSATTAARNILLNYPTEADGSCNLIYQPLIFKIVKQ